MYLCYSNVHGCGEGIVGALYFVHVIVRVNGGFTADLSSQHLDRPGKDLSYSWRKRIDLGGTGHETVNKKPYPVYSLVCTITSVRV